MAMRPEPEQRRELCGGMRRCDLAVESLGQMCFGMQAMSLGISMQAIVPRLPSGLAAGRQADGENPSGPA